MLYDYAAAGQGLKIVFISIIISICTGIVTMASALLGGILAIAVPLIAAYGYYVASKGHPDYNMPMYLSVLGAVLAVLTAILGGVPLLGTLLTIGGTVCNALVIHLVCVTTATLLAACGKTFSPNGGLVWKLYVGLALCFVLVTLLIGIPVLGLVLAILLVPLSIAMLVALVLYLMFIWKAQQALQAS